MGQGLGGDWDRCDGDGEKLVGLGWVWGEQVVPVQLSTPKAITVPHRVIQSWYTGR